VGAANGWRAYTFLLTVPHHRGNDLAQLINAILCSSSAMMSGRRWQAAKEEFGIIGRIRNMEVTWGASNGWHPHAHILLWTRKKLRRNQRNDLASRLYAVHQRAMKKVGFSGGLGRFFDLQPVQGDRAISSYLTKVEHSTMAAEMAQANMKAAFGQNPFQLAEAAYRGDGKALKLWHEYEMATKGKSFLQWGRGLKAEFGIGVASDEEIASDAITEAVEIVAVIAPDVWHDVQRLDLQIDVLDAAELGGAEWVNRVLRNGKAPP